MRELVIPRTRPPLPDHKQTHYNPHPSGKALVVRDGRESAMLASELVSGDLVILKTGDRVRKHIARVVQRMTRKDSYTYFSNKFNYFRNTHHFPPLCLFFENSVGGWGWVDDPPTHHIHHFLPTPGPEKPV